MEDVKFDGARLEALEREFRESGKDIDTFLRDRLRESGRPDADQVADDIIGTLAAIDANYSDIRKAKAEGFSRRQWLQKKFNDIRLKIKSDLSLGNATKLVGELVARVINKLRGADDVNPEDAEFIGTEADQLVEKLDIALCAKATCGQSTDIKTETTASEEK